MLNSCEVKAGCLHMSVPDRKKNLPIHNHLTPLSFLQGREEDRPILWFRQTANQGPGTHFINHSYGRGWWLFQTASANLKS